VIDPGGLGALAVWVLVMGIIVAAICLDNRDPHDPLT